MSNLRYFRYRRKSSEQEERQALSTESQKRELDAKFGDLTIVSDYEESHSAFHPYLRPKFAEMLERIKKGEADGVIAWHPDRLSRNEIDAAQITYLIRTGVIKDIKFGSYYFDNSPEGIMMLQLALSQSQYFSSKLGKDVKRGLKTKAQNGWLPAMAPAGYIHDPYAKKGNKKILKDQERFDLVKKALTLVVQGEKPKQVLKLLNEDWKFTTRKMGKTGGKPLSISGWYNILNNPFYYGVYEYPEESGNWYKGNHEPMITKEEFDIIQQRLGNKSRRRPSKKEFAYTGLMVCGECGCKITAEERWQTICMVCKTKFSSTHNTRCVNCQTDISVMDNPTILHYIHYHCTKKRKDKKCVQGAVEITELEKQIDKFLSKINISKVFRDWALKYLKQSNQREFEDRNIINKNIQQAYNEVELKLNSLLDLKLSNAITDEEYRQKKAQLLKEKEDIKEKLNDVDHRSDSWMKIVEDTFDFAQRARHQFKYASKEEKRTLLSEIGSNLKLFNKIVDFDSEKPFEVVIDAKKLEPKTDARFEPDKSPYTKPQLEQFFASNPLLLPGLDSNQ